MPLVCGLPWTDSCEVTVVRTSALRRSRLLVACMMLVVVTAAGCAGPTVTDGGYRAKTACTLKDISSALATVTLAEHLVC